MLTREWAGPVRRAADLPLGPIAADEPAPVDPGWAAADDAVLVEACLAGHRGAYDVIVERHQKQIYRVCYRFVGNHADAADLAQDVFIRAYRGLRGFKSTARLSTWLYRIAVNTSLNRVSARSAVREPVPGPAHHDRPDDAVVPADEMLLRGERAARVRGAIARLPPRQRATLVLRVYHDLPHAEIAKILGGSVGAVKTNFFHALANLRKLLR